MTTPYMAAREMEKAILSGQVTDTTKTRTVDWYKHLLNDEQASREIILRGIVL